MTMFESPKVYLASLELPRFDVPAKADSVFESESGAPDILEEVKKSDTFINAGSVVAFTGDLKESRVRRGVLDSLLFAQLASSKSHDRMSDPVSWYREYQRVLTNLGWTISASALVQQRLQKSNVELADSAIDLMIKMLGGLSLQVLEAALEAMRGLKDDDGLISVFDENSMSDTVANFQIGQATQDSDGNVSMPLGMFYFRSSETKKRFLFFRWKRKEVSLLGDAQVITLNVAQYFTVEDIVNEKLENAREAFLASISL